MEPAAVLTAVTLALGYLVRVLCRWNCERSEVRKTELVQQGLSDRVRSLPAGSRIVEKERGREVEIVVGDAGPSGLR
ncbi:MULTISPECIES: hypothetical protein [Streptomyces]|uniref:hypothetical protein n=1 Tax=Streptomyces TaxID=1883 RepID=UPI0006AEB8E4|nr:MULTISPECIES: hypothetical protein [unclassified Streptomyces]GLV95833.1 hypothetical protein Slala04_72860 [Streptomyces lavendulae subsp. lavendulae]KOU77761.1 hypothetical protein ADK94_35560 [Streptomyces sp. XY593]KOU89650.1 hypothetical protein ADK92_37015 [Streptomyces sp. XY533]KOV17057.1 hypothetical protein ADK91_03145 [Streptomyces sp. XY511]MCI4078927.1 hypothetical protein [Streptomyces sp. MMS21 TC-5]